MADIDYEATCQKALEIIKKQINTEDAYFSLLKRVQELSRYSDTVAENIFDIKLADQILLFKALVQSGEIAKYLCEKYRLCDKAEMED